MSESELSEQLLRAQEEVRELQLTRDALQSSVESLNVLVSNERAQTRAAKRRLSAEEKAAPEAAKLAEKVEQLRALLEEKDKQLERLRSERRGGEISSVSTEVLSKLEARLDEETCLKESIQNECARLERQVADLQSQIERKDGEVAWAKRASDDVEKRLDETICREQTLEKELRDKSALICKLEITLREKAAAVDSLGKAVSEIPSLRSRLLEMENKLRVSERVEQLLTEREGVTEGACQEWQNDDVEDESCGKMEELIAGNKNKLTLQIARNIIAEKDKIIGDMSRRLSIAEANQLKTALASKATEQRANSVNEALVVAQLELKEARFNVSAQSISYAVLEQSAAELANNFARATQEREAFSKKLEEHESTMKSRSAFRANMEETLGNAEKELWAVREQASALQHKLTELQGEKKLHDDFRQSMEKSHEIAEEQRIKAVKEAQSLKDSLEASEKEVARLEGLLANRGAIVDDFGASSPCSTDPGVEERNHTTFSYAESIQKVSELEEAVKLAKSSYEQKCLEAQTLASSVSDNATTIVTLNKALLVSRQVCDEKHEKLEAFIAKANGLERCVQKLKAELASRMEECDFLENRVRSELEPSLLKTNSELDQRVSELKITREEFELHKDLSEKTRFALESERGSLSERLQKTLSILSSTQSNLTQSEQKGADLENEIASLVSERKENIETIEGLKSRCEHRYQALMALESRLLRIEQTVAGYEQAALDANRERESLTELLEQALDKQDVAEKRATRKDEATRELEETTKELKCSYAIARDNLQKKTSELNGVRHELNEVKEVVEIKDQALQSQGKIARDREALFESVATELRRVIASRDKALELVREDLRIVERRVESLIESLEGEKEKLKYTQNALETSRRQHNDCQAQNERLQTRLGEAQEEFSRLKSEHQVALGDLATKRNQLSDQSSSITEKERIIAGLVTEKAQLDKLILEVREELVDENNNSNSLEARIVTLGTSLSERTSALSLCKEELAARTTEAESVSRSFAEAQANISNLENTLAEREIETETNQSVVKNLETCLARAEQRMSVLESHLDGHDTLVKDRREKEEALAIKCSKLEQAAAYIASLEENREGLCQRLAATEGEMELLSRKASSFENEKASLESELTKAQDARIAAESSLRCTAASLDALEVSSAEEIEELKQIVASLRKVNDEYQSAHETTHDAVPGPSLGADHFMRMQLAELRNKNERLQEKLVSVESDVASKQEILAGLESKYQHMEETLRNRDDEVERLERNLVDRSQALSFARSKIEDLTTKTAAVAKNEVLTWQTMLEAKEKAIANLHNWCCFINSKLHTAEKALADREVDIETLSATQKKLEEQLQQLNDVLIIKENQIRGMESS